MASNHFTFAFQESYFTINGKSALHLVITSDEPATSSILYSFDVTLQTIGGAYQKAFAASMPEGSTRLSIPFIVPLEWANDFAQNIGDTAHPHACGEFTASMTVHYTMYAGTQVFTNDYRGFGARISGTVDDSLQPTVGEVNVSAADGKVPAAWGVWVQGISTAHFAVPGAAGCYGSTIVAYAFGLGGMQTDAQADILLKESGTVTVPVTVQDSRGRIATKDIVLTVLPYAVPALSVVSSHRCDAQGTPDENGSCFQAGFTLAASALGGKNAAAVSCAWKKVTEESYGAPVALSTSGQILSAALEQGASYDVKYTVSDAFYQIDTYDYVSSTVYLLHFLKGGTGIAVGKAAEQANLFDVGLDTKLRRDVTVGGSLAVTGGLTLSGTDVGTALAGIGSIASAACALETQYLPEASENMAVRCGRMMLCRLHGTMQNGQGGGPIYEGDAYPVATLPAGYYSAEHLPAAFAYQNAKACKACVDTAGKIYVIPAADGAEDTEVFCFGIV
jgi:hypothetical protein